MKKLIIVFFLLLTTLIVPTGTGTDEIIPNPVFEMTLMSPNTVAARSAWSEMIANELPKIGINASFEHIGWELIGPRTWGHQDAQTGKIPSHQNGGFDVFSVYLEGDFDFDPTRYYNSSRFMDENYAVYSNPKLDELMANYTMSLDFDERDNYAKEIQEIIIEDVPYIPIMYGADIWPWHIKSIGGWSGGIFMMLAHDQLHDAWKDLDVSDNGNLVFGLGDIYNLHPLQSWGYNEMTFSAIFQGLYERDHLDYPQYRYKPMIAQDFPVWDDNYTVATVEIKDGITFSNGHVLDAFDIEYSYHVWLSSDSTDAYRDPLKMHLKKSNQREMADMVTALNATHIQFEFEKPYFKAIELMSYPIMDEEVMGPVNSLNNEWENDPVIYAIGSGPFKYSSTDFSKVQLVPNENYWNGIPKLSNIEFKAYSNKQDGLADLKNGAVDVLDFRFDLEIGDVIDQDGISYFGLPDLTTHVLTVNMNHPILGTGEDTPLGQNDPSKAKEAAKYVRKAISHLIDRDKIISDIYMDDGSRPATSLWPYDADHYYGQTYHSYDPERAKSYLEMAGYTITYPEITSNTTTIFTSNTTTTSSQVNASPTLELPLEHFILTMSTAIFCILHVRKKNEQ